MKKIVLAVLFPLLLSCATEPPPELTAPTWVEVPSAILDAFCARLKMDAIATGSPVTVVASTRPLATPQSLNALALTARGRPKGNRVGTSIAEFNRELPITTAGSTCRWTPIAVADIDAHHDELLVELSAPGVNPFSPTSGGMFARVTVGGEVAGGYWITLIPAGGQWVVGPVYVLVE